MQYPKMLYKGNTAKYQHIIAKDDEHEEELKDQGYVDFGQLKAPKPTIPNNLTPSTPVGQASVDSQEFAKITHERDQLKAEVERLNAVIERGSAENIALKEQLGALSSSDDPNLDLEPQAQKPKTTRAKAE